MKTTSRKRLLISSVAMLLVAMLALGTATFAWFTQDTRSYADQLNARTSKVSSLVLSKQDRTNWQSHIQYGVDNRIMYPASSSNGSDWFFANASDAVSGAVDKTSIKDAKAPGVTTADYVFSDELNIKNSGAVKVKDVKITFTLQGENSDYARVALVPIGVDGSAITTNGTFVNTVFAKTATPYQPISSLSGDLGASITPSTKYEVKVPDLDVDQAAYYALYVWFEGQDEDCIDAKSGQKIPGLVFDVDGTPVEE